MASPPDSEHRSRLFFVTTVDFQLRYHRKLYQRLRREGWDVHLVSEGGPILSALAAEGFRTHVIKLGRLPSIRDVVSLHAASALVRRWQPDVVVAGSPKASLVFMRAASSAASPVRVYVVWGLRSEGGGRLARLVARMWERDIIRHATHVVAVSASIRDALTSSGLLRGTRATVIGRGSTSGVSVSHFSPATHPRPLTHIGYIGRITRDKGMLELAEAVRLLHARNLAVNLTIMGPVEDQLCLNALTALQTEFSIPVTVLPYGLDPAPALREIGLFVLPTYREGLPNVVLEAFAAEVPVVATRVTGVVDLVDETTGYLAEPRSASSLASALAEAITDEPTARGRAQNAKRTVLDHFTDEHVVGLWVEYLREQAPRSATASTERG